MKGTKNAMKMYKCAPKQSRKKRKKWKQSDKKTD